jgi:hypothetical protein
MSKAPSVSAENASAHSISAKPSSDSGTARRAASRLMRLSSEDGWCGLQARSMRCISSNTACTAASPARASSAHSSTWMAVPMATSSRWIHPAGAAAHGVRVAESNRRCIGWAKACNMGSSQVMTAAP